METAYPDIFAQFEKLIEIDILGTIYMVPENNSLLRCFQFLSMETISLGEFCWNGDCLNCCVILSSDGKEKKVITCRTTVTEGMRIIKLDDHIEL